MGIWDDLRRGVQSVADAVSSEAGKVSLQTQIGEAERAIWALYSQMGYRALELLRGGEIADGKLSELDAQLVPLQEKLDGLRSRLQAAGPDQPAPSASPAGPSPSDPPTG